MQMNYSGNVVPQVFWHEKLTLYASVIPTSHYFIRHLDLTFNLNFMSKYLIFNSERL